jgi:2-haloacid dehalogenase
MWKVKGMSATSPVLVFDVNETLSDMSPLAARFVDVGASASTAQLWFSWVLRDGFALTVAGESKPFATVGEELLRVLLPTAVLNRPVEEAVEHVMAGMHCLDLHPDVAPAIRELAEDGHRMVTLSNGSTSIAEELLATASLVELFERLLSVEAVGVWKPAAEAYRYAARVCEVDPADMMLVAVHPWDVDGAARAGLSTVWLDRSESHYPATFTPPTHTVASLEELSDILGKASV